MFQCQEKLSQKSPFSWYKTSPSGRFMLGFTALWIGHEQTVGLKSLALCSSNQICKWMFIHFIRTNIFKYYIIDGPSPLETWTSLLRSFFCEAFVHLSLPEVFSFFVEHSTFWCRGLEEGHDRPSNDERRWCNRSWIWGWPYFGWSIGQSFGYGFLWKYPGHPKILRILIMFPSTLPLLRHMPFSTPRLHVLHCWIFQP